MPDRPATRPGALNDALRVLPAAPVCVAYSGGLDSTVLLHVLATSPTARANGLRAWHVHHGLHDHADAWVDHCRAACDALGVPLTVSWVDVARDGEGLEAAARQARHAAFAAGLGDGEVLALAHHRDDQAETFLLRALRASGPDGLGAMPTWRDIGRGRLWRPLLPVSREQLEAYAREHALEWIEDPSNTDAAFDRNFLRQKVLPLLRERWPHAGAALATSAALCTQSAQLLAEGDVEALARVITVDRHVLSIPALRSLPPARRARVLRRWIEQLGLPPLPSAGIEQIEGGLLEARADAQATFVWHGAAIRAWRDLLHAGRVVAALPAQWQAEWDGRDPLPLPGGGSLLLVGAGAFETPLVARSRRGGERIVLPKRAHSQSLQNVLQDLGVPPWERKRLPLLATCEGELLAAGDLVVSARLDTWLRAAGARLRWSPDLGAARDS